MSVSHTTKVFPSQTEIDQHTLYIEGDYQLSLHQIAQNQMGRAYDHLQQTEKMFRVTSCEREKISEHPPPHSSSSRVHLYHCFLVPYHPPAGRSFEFCHQSLDQIHYLFPRSLCFYPRSLCFHPQSLCFPPQSLYFPP